MARGKQTCKILKEIRRQIAEANDIEFVTSECRYKGDCLGTCPKCEAEVRYLEQQLHKRQLAGKLVNLAGISAGAIAMLAPISAQSQTPDTSLPMGDIAVHAATDTIKVKGKVLGETTGIDGTIVTDTLIGAAIRNLNSQKIVVTDIEGDFEIGAFLGDSIEVSYVGFNTRTIAIIDKSPLLITLNDKGIVLLGECAVVSKPSNMIDLIITDEKGNKLDPDDISIKLVSVGNEDVEEWPDIYPKTIYDENDGRLLSLRIYWHDEPELWDENDSPLKEATLRIEVDGYDTPQKIKVKYPKRNTRKTIRFKHKK